MKISCDCLAVALVQRGSCFAIATEVRATVYKHIRLNNPSQPAYAFGAFIGSVSFI